MSKADGGLRKELTRWLPKPDWEWTAIETGGTLAGVPDSFWVNKTVRVSGWVECKHTDGWAVEVRPHQVGWCSRHAAAGVRVTIAIRAQGKGSSGGAGDSLWLVRGSAVKELQELGLEGLPSWAVLGMWKGPPRSWEWAEIGAILARDCRREPD